MRRGDWAVLVGATAIAVYEHRVRDEADLISSRTLAYKATHPLLTYGFIWVTALHLTGDLPPTLDPYHQLLRFFRPKG
jgi:hypothetical protein